MNGLGAVISTNYHAAGEKLLVSFSCGRIFVFEYVPVAIAAGFGDAREKTTFFNTWIRGKFPWVEIADGQSVRHPEHDPFVR